VLLSGHRTQLLVFGEETGAIETTRTRITEAQRLAQALVKTRRENPNGLIVLAHQNLPFFPQEIVLFFLHGFFQSGLQLSNSCQCLVTLAEFSFFGSVVISIVQKASRLVLALPSHSYIMKTTNTPLANQPQLHQRVYHF
jgi:hypothetical protein